jgi:isopentenyldiphosphate isomerase
MPEEIFDVVNDRDEVIDHKPRSEVHRLGLLHRAVHVLVFNARGETFLQKRSMTKDREPGKWDSSTSGHLDSGEDYDVCAVRELREELGLDLGKTRLTQRRKDAKLKSFSASFATSREATSASQPMQKLFKIDACPETDQEFVWVYRCRAEGPFRLHPDEIERGGWFAPDKISSWVAAKPEDFASAFRLIWRTLNR